MLPSAGLHTNGFSLARKVFFEIEGLGVDDRVDELGGTVGELLLAPHRSYLASLSGPVEAGRIHALAHITGGGLTDNVPRVLPDGLGARIDRSSWTVPGVFRRIQQSGGVADDEMFRAFNMGIGMVAVVDAGEADGLTAELETAGEQVRHIGTVEAGSSGVRYG